MCMYDEKLDVSGLEQFGCEGWLHQCVDQLPDSKSDPHGKPTIMWWFPTMLFLGTTAFDQSALQLNS
jgi:hypothetical protein